MVILHEHNFIQNLQYMLELMTQYEMDENDLKIFAYVFTAQTGVATSWFTKDEKYYVINYSRMVSRMDIYPGYTCKETTLHDKIKKKHIDRLVKCGILKYELKKGVLTSPAGKKTSGTFPHMRIPDEIFNKLKVVTSFDYEVTDGSTEHILMSVLSKYLIINNSSASRTCTSASHLSKEKGLVLNNNNANQINYKQAVLDQNKIIHNQEDKIDVLEYNIKEQNKLITEQEHELNKLTETIFNLNKRISVLEQNNKNLLDNNNTNPLAVFNNNVSKNGWVDYSTCTAPEIPEDIYGSFRYLWRSNWDFDSDFIQNQLRVICDRYKENDYKVVRDYLYFLKSTLFPNGKRKKVTWITGGTAFIEKGIATQAKQKVKQAQNLEKNKIKGRKNAEIKKEEERIQAEEAAKPKPPVTPIVIRKLSSKATDTINNFIFECPVCKNKILGEYEVCSGCQSPLDYTHTDFSEYITT